MSLFHSYDPERRAVLEPSDYQKPVPGFPETLVVTFQPGLMDTVAAMEGAEVVDTIREFMTFPIYRVPYKGKTLGVYQTLLGAAASAVMLEEIIARGGKRFLLFGSCGCLAEGLAPGQFILPTAAYRDEGVSYHYLPAADYIELDTQPRMAQVFAELGLPYLEGRTWTTDGLYRETKRNLAARQAEGCVAVDMECSAMAAVCRYRGVEFYQFLYTEDDLSGAAWDPGLLGKMPRNAHEAHLKIAMEAAVRI
ncbi:MAG: phosphorylase [Clostridia bacterium]|nr:phosphorylase [Clostridia bacterium]